MPRVRAGVNSALTMLLGASLLAACATQQPLQTASVVRAGHHRVVPSLTVSPWCSVSLDPTRYCNAIPQGLPIPELRLAARHGLGYGADLGASVQVAAALGRGYQVGGSADVKKELWSRPLGDDRRQVLSTGLLLGYSSVQLSNAFGGASLGVVDALVPVHFGHQTERFEWVVTARVLERLTFSDRQVPRGGARDLDAATEVGLLVGLIGRGRYAPGLELGYQVDVGRPLGGLFLLNAGFAFDLGGQE